MSHAARWNLRLLSAVFAAFLIALAATPADADDVEQLVQALGDRNFSTKITAVGDLAATGDPRAVPVLDAMLAGDLAVRSSDSKVVIIEHSGRTMIVRDPLTLAEIGEAQPADIDAITVNNRLRGVLRGALGGLTLLSPDADRRRAAADAVFKTADATLLPLLEKAQARETDTGVRERMDRALAAMRVSTATGVDQRLAAIATLRGFPDPDVRSLLANIAASDTDPAVHKAARDALDHVELRLTLWGLLGNVFQGVSLGSVLLLAAVGLAITFGVMGVINMAHGEMVMLGAYTTFVVQDLFRTYAPGALDYALLVAVPSAFVVTGLVGIAVERSIIRFLYGRPLETLLATWGLSLILQQVVRTVFGPSNREVSNPSWMSGAVDLVGGLTLTYNRIWIIVFSLVVFALLMLLIRGSAFGLQMRAVTQNRRMAAAMGIRTGAVDALTFGLGSAIAGIAGVALSQIDNVSPNLGQSYIIDSFMVVVFGGVGNLWGTLVGGLSLGLVNKFLEPYAGAVLGKILVLVAIILFIQKRPRGLFALKGRAVEN
ncbi:MAG: urea ABC transporter permease subunit UrtB [Rhodospirillales bacterium]|nr:urea ABC transporter permease subunit UrtB [Rhodospirillales bacterium]